MTQQRQAGESLRSIGIQEWCELAREGAAPSVTIRLDGDSMRPLIRRNRDEVTIQPLNRPLRTGDVVLFQSRDGRYIVHRVRRLRGSSLQTLGDNCWNPDPWIEEKQVLGLAAAVKRNGRSISLNTALSRGLGRAWLAFRPLRNLWRGAKSRAARMIRRIYKKRR